MYVSNGLSKAGSMAVQCRGESIFVPVTRDTYEKLECGVALSTDRHAISNKICVLNNVDVLSFHPCMQSLTKNSHMREKIFTRVN